jgi:hypothetical protein
MSVFLLLKECCGVMCYGAPSVTGGRVCHVEGHSPCLFLFCMCILIYSLRIYVCIYIYIMYVYLHSLHSRPIRPRIVQQIMSKRFYLWTVTCLTATKFEPFKFSVLVFVFACILDIQSIIIFVWLDIDVCRVWRRLGVRWIKVRANKKTWKKIVLIRA